MPNSRPILPPVESIDGHDELLLRETSTGRRRRWKRALYALLAVALMAGVIVGARPALHLAKAWQARRLARQAVDFTRSGKIDEARAKVQDALAIWQLEPEAQYAAALLLTRAGAYRQAEGFWEKLEKTRPLKSDELRDYVTVELNLGDLDHAEALLRRVWPASESGTREDWMLGMQIALRRGRGAEAVAVADRILADAPAPARERLNAAVVVISSHAASAEQRAEAWRDVAAIAQNGTSIESLTALILMAQQQSSDAATRSAVAGLPPAADLIARIDAHPAAKAQHHLLALDLQIALEPSRKAEFVQLAMARFGQTKDDGDLLTFAAWLYAKGEFEKVFQLLPPERAAADRALYLQYLDTLAALGRWTDIRASIQARRLALDPMLAQMFLARCASQLGESAVRDARWQGALDAAGRDPAKLIAVGQYAAKNGVIPIAVAAFEDAIRADPEAREPHDELVQVLQSAGDTGKLRAAVEVMVERWPHDPSVRNEKAYLDALVGENVAAARDTARDLVRADGGAHLGPRVTLALSELRLQRGLAALDAFAGFDFAHTSALEPRPAAVYAAVLWETSFPKEARQTLKGLPMDRLLPEERELIAPIPAEPAS